MTEQSLAKGMNSAKELNSSPIVQLAESIKKLRQLTQVDVQQGWRFWAAALPLTQATQSHLWQDWPKVSLNSRAHIAWSAGKQVLWLGQKFVVPEHLNGYPLEGLTLRLALTWWADHAQIFVEGDLLQEGDLFDCSARILLSPGVKMGEEITVALRLVSPDHDQGALVRSCLIFEPASEDRLDPGRMADELAVLQGYLEKFQPERLADLAVVTQQINWSALPDVEKFERFLKRLYQDLQPFSEWLKQRQISFLGHAHLDLAWLWPVSETWEVAERTFQSILALQKDFPELIFCHSTPALYAWIEEHRPELFAAIQKQVVAGNWEVVAGCWVEPELNLVSGESLVRQVLYGQRYVQEKFGYLSSIAWLPDSFGFCWQLPQILTQAGVKYFVTQKLRWNDTTEFPYQAFWWRSPDGSEIFSVMSAPIGESMDPVKMATFAQQWEAATGSQETLWLPGVGDHGGGPTRDMLEIARSWQRSPLFPQLKSTTAERWLRNFQSQVQDVPVWQDELYLEFHRGCYTSHGDQKRANRRSENLLYEAELFACLATLTAGAVYPKAELESAWKQTLFNQFHDILPGSSIPPVFAEANQAWAEVEQIGRQILQAAWAAIAAEISLPQPPCPSSLAIVVFNSLNWQRSEVVSLPLPDALATNQNWQVADLEGNRLPSQIQTDSVQPALLFLATDIPSIGYRVFWLSASLEEPTPPCSSPQDFVLENQHLRVEVNPDTGNLSSVFDKADQREVLSGPGNQLQFFQDSGQYWDAWNINPDYAAHPLPPAQLKSIQWLNWESWHMRLRVVRQINQSQFSQDYVLQADSAVLKIETTVNWQERQVLVKAAFPLTVESNYVTYEIPCAAIQRPTLPHPQPLELREQAKWEVPALHWADLSSASGPDAYGVSLLNDCKYGYSAQPHQLCLTLLRSPNWPDPNSDRGLHQFSYALYPHPGSWQTAQTPRRGYELNRPLQAFLYDPPEAVTARQLPPVSQFLNLQANNLILMAVKQAEDEPEQWILRCYECCGETAQLDLQNHLNLVVHQRVDLLERPTSCKEINSIEPWTIGSFLLS